MKIEEALIVTDDWIVKCRHLIGETQWTEAVIALRTRIAELEAIVEEAHQYLSYVEEPVNAVLIAKDALEDAFKQMQAARDAAQGGG